MQVAFKSLAKPIDRTLLLFFLDSTISEKRWVFLFFFFFVGRIICDEKLLFMTLHMLCVFPPVSALLNCQGYPLGLNSETPPSCLLQVTVVV